MSLYAIHSHYHHPSPSCLCPSLTLPYPKHILTSYNHTKTLSTVHALMSRLHRRETTPAQCCIRVKYIYHIQESSDTFPFVNNHQSWPPIAPCLNQATRQTNPLRISKLQVSKARQPVLKQARQPTLRQARPLPPALSKHTCHPWLLVVNVPKHAPPSKKTQKVSQRLQVLFIQTPMSLKMTDGSSGQSSSLPWHATNLTRSMGAREHARRELLSLVGARSKTSRPHAICSTCLIVPKLSRRRRWPSRRRGGGAEDKIEVASTRAVAIGQGCYGDRGWK